MNVIVHASHSSVRSWYGGPFYSNGTIDYSILRTISRTYAPAVAGEIVSMKFDPSTAEFNLVFANNPNCTEATDIYLNQQLHYPYGYRVTTTPTGAAAWSSLALNHIKVTVDASVPAGTEIAIDITAK